MPTETEIAWLAGLLEGEGHFRASVDTRPNRRIYLRVQLKMTDQDVLIRAAALFPSRTKVNKCSLDRRFHRKPLYEKIWNGADAELVMRAVLPYMCVRRTAAIEQCLATPNLSHHPREAAA